MPDRNCLECVHCEFSCYEPGYGEMTPSSPMSVWCAKGLNGSGSDSWEGADTKREAAGLYEGPVVFTLERAKACPEFSPEDWA